ncbi:unnamed protein product, partial [Musa banksii]
LCSAKLSNGRESCSNLLLLFPCVSHLRTATPLSNTSRRIGEAGAGAGTEDLVRGETLVGQSNSHRQLGLRLLSGGLQRAAAERRLLRPRYPHLPCFHRHEPLLPGDGQEQVELLLRQLGARRDDRPE